MYEYARITAFDISLSTSLVLGYSASLSAEAILVYRLSVAFLVKDLPAFGFSATHIWGAILSPITMARCCS